MILHTHFCWYFCLAKHDCYKQKILLIESSLEFPRLSSFYVLHCKKIYQFMTHGLKPKVFFDIDSLFLFHIGKPPIGKA